MARLGASNHSTKVAPGKVDRRRNEYKNAIKQAFNEKEFLNVLEVLKRKALEGDIKAITVVMHYVLGKPTEHLQVENVEPRQFSVEIVDTPQGKVTTLGNAEGEPLVKFND